MTNRRTVTLVWSTLLQYRVPFYEALRARLDEEGIDLRLVVSESDRAIAARGDSAELSWATTARIRRVTVRGVSLVWQSFGSAAEGSDLVVLEQGNRLVSNLPLLARRSRGQQPPIAFWGHGLSATARGPIRDRVKAFLARRVDWWFVYTGSGERDLVSMGIPADSITVVRNSIDTAELRDRLDAVGDRHLADLESELGIPAGAPVVLTIAGFDPDKEPEFTVDALMALRERVPDVHALLCGGGPDAGVVAEAAAAHAWVHHLGPTFGVRLAACLRRASVMVQPGKIGLVAVDSLTSGTPIVTIADRPHAPEFDYLVDGRNAVVVDGPPSTANYADAVASLLGDRSRLDPMRTRAEADAADLGVDVMADNFAAGILRVLR